MCVASRNRWTAIPVMTNLTLHGVCKWLTGCDPERLAGNVPFAVQPKPDRYAANDCDKKRLSGLGKRPGDTPGSLAD